MVMEDETSAAAGVLSLFDTDKSALQEQCLQRYFDNVIQRQRSPFNCFSFILTHVVVKFDRFLFLPLFNFGRTAQ